MSYHHDSNRFYDEYERTNLYLQFLMLLDERCPIGAEALFNVLEKEHVGFERIGLDSATRGSIAAKAIRLVAGIQ
jgi:hypothetical protein